jgi:hypothetical protein
LRISGVNCVASTTNEGVETRQSIPGYTSSSKKKLSNPYVFNRTNTSKNLMEKTSSSNLGSIRYNAQSAIAENLKLREKSLPSTCGLRSNGA